MNKLMKKPAAGTAGPIEKNRFPIKKEVLHV